MILGLPTISFLMLIGIPTIILVIMLYDSWRIMTGRKK
jgi:hypothetical protein